MTEQAGRDPTRWRVLKQGLDITATLAMLVAAGAVVWAVTRPRGPEAPPPPPLPAEPVSIEGAPTLGDDNAPVVLIEFSDFECPYCGQFATQVLPELKAKYLETGLVQLAFRHMPLTAIHPRAFRAAEAAECAARQGHFWTFHDRFFDDTAELGEEDLQEHAVAAALDIDTFATCLQGAAMEQIRSDMAMAESLGVRGTPTLLVGIRDGEASVRVREIVRGLAPVEALTRLLDDLMEE